MWGSKTTKASSLCRVLSITPAVNLRCLLCPFSKITPVSRAPFFLLRPQAWRWRGGRLLGWMMAHLQGGLGSILVGSVRPHLARSNRGSGPMQDRGPRPSTMGFRPKKNVFFSPRLVTAVARLVDAWSDTPPRLIGYEAPQLVLFSQTGRGFHAGMTSATLSGHGPLPLALQKAVSLGVPGVQTQRDFVKEFGNKGGVPLD